LAISISFIVVALIAIASSLLSVSANCLSLMRLPCSKNALALSQTLFTVSMVTLDAFPRLSGIVSGAIFSSKVRFQVLKMLDETEITQAVSRKGRSRDRRKLIALSFWTCPECFFFEPAFCQLHGFPRQAFDLHFQSPHHQTAS